MVEIDEDKELQMGAMKTLVSEMERTALYAVEFLGKNIAAWKKRFRYKDQFDQIIIEVHDESENWAKRARSNHNLGVASFRHFDDIQIQE